VRLVCFAHSLGSIQFATISVLQVTRTSSRHRSLVTTPLLSRKIKPHPLLPLSWVPAPTCSRSNPISVSQYLSQSLQFSSHSSQEPLFAPPLDSCIEIEHMSDSQAYVLYSAWVPHFLHFLPWATNLRHLYAVFSVVPASVYQLNASLDEDLAQATSMIMVRVFRSSHSREWTFPTIVVYGLLYTRNGLLSYSPQ
jgi:hypothetical protein